MYSAASGVLRIRFTVFTPSCAAQPGRRYGVKYGNELGRYQDRKVELFKVNIDDNRPLAGRYQVQSIPVILLFRFTEMRSGALGNQNAAQINKMIDDEEDPPKEPLKQE